MAYRPVDADTYQDTETGERFRLAGGNAAESYTPEGAALKQDPTLLARVNAAKRERLGQDHFGRTVTELYNPDGSNLNQQMVTERKLGAVDYTGAGQMYTAPYVAPAEPTAEQWAALGGKPAQMLPSTPTPKQEPTWIQKIAPSIARSADTATADYFGTVSALGNLISRDPDGAGPQADTRTMPDYVKDAKGNKVRNPDLSLRDRFSNWLQRTGEKGYMRNMQEAKQNPKTASFQGVLEGKNDLLSLVAESFGEAIPSILEMVGAGAAVAATGGLAGAALGAAASRGALGAGARAYATKYAEQQLTNAVRKRIVAGAFDPAMKGMAQVEAQQMAKGVIANLPEYATRFAANKPVIDALRAKSVASWAGGQAAGIGGRLGAFGSSAGMQAGQFYEEDKNAEGGVASPGRSLLAGAAAGVLDVAGIEFLLHRFLKPGVDIKTAMDVVKHIGAQGALGMGGEGVTEAVQEVIGVLNNEWDNPSNVPLLDRMTSKENLWRYAEAGVAGAIFGGIFGGAGGAVSGMVNKQSTPTPSPEPSSPGAPITEPAPESGPGAGPPPLDETAPPVGSASPTGPIGPAGAPEASPTESPVVQASPQSDPVVDTTGQPPPVVPPAPLLPPSESTRRPRLPLETPTGESQGRQDHPSPPSEAPQVLETGKPVVIKPSESVAEAAPKAEPPAPAPKVEPPAPKAEPPAPAPKVEPPAPKVEPPAPKVEPPAPAPKVEPPAPAPKVEPPAPAPKVEPPAPAPKVEPPAPKVLAPAKPKAEAKAKPSVAPAPKVKSPSAAGTQASVVAESPLSIKTKDLNDPRLSGKVFRTEAEAKSLQDALWELGVQTGIEDETQTPFALRSVASETNGAEWTAAQSGILGYAHLHAVQKALDAVGGDPKALKTALNANPKVTGATYDSAYAAAVRSGLKPGEFVVGMRGKAFAYAPLKAPAAKAEAPAKAPTAKAEAPAAKVGPSPAKKAQYEAARNKAKAATVIAKAEAPAAKSKSMAEEIRTSARGIPQAIKDKDARKAELMTQFIGEGAAGTSTADYAQWAGDKANTGKYEASDTVFVSVNGKRAGRTPLFVDGKLNGAFQNLAKAVAAKATILADNAEHRGRGFNVGEQELATWLTTNGYVETPGKGIEPSVWTPAKAESPTVQAEAPAAKVGPSPAKMAQYEAARNKAKGAAVAAAPMVKAEAPAKAPTVKAEAPAKAPMAKAEAPAKVQALINQLRTLEEVATGHDDGVLPNTDDWLTSKAVEEFYTLHQATLAPLLGAAQEQLKTADDATRVALMEDAPVADFLHYGLNGELYKKQAVNKDQGELFSKRHAPTPGQTPDQFRAAIKHKLLDRANIHVLHRTTDAPFPVAPDTAGLYLPDGSAWFFTENIAPGEEWAKVFHEVGAHYGLARMVGRDAYAAILKDLKRMVAGDGFASVKEAHRRAVAAGATGAGVYHETLGYLAELSPRHGLVRRLITAVRQFLRSIGLVKAYTDADLVGLIQAAALKEGLEGRVGLSKGQLRSTKEGGVIRTLKNALDDLSITLEESNQGVGEIDLLDRIGRIAAGAEGERLIPRIAARFFTILGHPLPAIKNGLWKTVELLPGYKALESPISTDKLDIISQALEDAFNGVTHPDSVFQEQITAFAADILKRGTDVLVPESAYEGRELVDLEKLLVRFPQHAELVKKFSAAGFTLTGSASLGAQGSVLRPDENPFHDLDFTSPLWLTGEPEHVYRQAVQDVLGYTQHQIARFHTIEAKKQVWDKAGVDPNTPGFTTFSYWVPLDPAHVLTVAGVGKKTQPVVIDKATGKSQPSAATISIDIFPYKNTAELQKAGVRISRWDEIIAAKFSFIRDGEGLRDKDVIDYALFKGLVPRDTLGQKLERRFETHDEYQKVPIFKKYGLEGFENHPKLRGKVNEAVKLLDRKGFPKTLMEGLSRIAVATKSSEPGMLWENKLVMALSQTTLETGSIPDIAAVIAHELTHDLDFQLQRGQAETHSSPLFAIEKDAKGKVTLGPIIKELYSLYTTNKEGLLKTFRYPFIDLQNAIAKGNQEKLAGIKSEAFAQAGMLYWMNPAALQKAAPKTYALLETVYAKESEPARRNHVRYERTRLYQRVRGALWPPSSPDQGPETGGKANGRPRNRRPGPGMGRVAPQNAGGLLRGRGLVSEPQFSRGSLTIEPTLDDRGGKRLVVGYGIFGNGQLLESFDSAEEAAAALKKNRAEYEGYLGEAGAKPVRAEFANPRYKGVLENLDKYLDTDKKEREKPRFAPIGHPSVNPIPREPDAHVVDYHAALMRHVGQLHAASPEGDPAKPKLASHLAPTPLARLESPALAAMAESLRAIKDPVDAAEHALSLMAAPEAEGIAQLLNQYRRIFAQNLSPERTLGAIEYLYATTLQQSDQLRALTAFVSQDDLPLHEHLLRALDAFDALRRADSSVVADIERNMLPTAEADTAFGQKERDYLATVKAQQEVGNSAGEIQVQSLYERDMLVHDTLYPTAALGKVISPLVTRTDSADSQASKDEKSWRARKRLPALEQQLLALQDQAAANPSQTAEVALGDMEAWLNDGALTEAGEQLRTAMKKGKPDGQESKLLADLQLQRAWHDATAAPYGVLVLKYDAQRLGGDKGSKHSGRYLLVERITTFDPDLLQLVEDPKTKDLVTPKEWVRRLISEVTAYWDGRPEARNEDFWKDNVLEFHAVDKLFAPYPGELSGGPVDMAGVLEGKKTRKITLTAKQVVKIGKMMYKAIGSPLGQTPLMNYEMGLQTLLYDSGTHYVMTQASEQVADRKLLTGPYIAPGVVVTDDKKGLWLGDARQAQARGQADLGVAADDELRAFKEWVERKGENSTAFKNWMKEKGLGNLRFQESPKAQKVYATLLKKWQSQQTNESPAFEEWLDNKENVAFLDRPDLQGKEGETTDGRGLNTEEEQAGYSARMGRIGETSTKVTGEKALPHKAGVSRHEGTEAHGVVSKIVKALNLNSIHVSLYNRDDVSDLLDAVEPYTQTYNRLRQGLLGATPKKAAVAFIDGRILLYYDKNLTGKELAWALGHEMGHVVLRTVLENERRRSTVLWRRLLSQYQASESPESFMEWFADQAAQWSLEDRSPKNLIEAFYRRVVDYFNKLLGAIGAKATPNAVHAYLDGLALKERAMEYQALAEALRGTTRYDLLTLQQTYHGADTMQRLVLDSPELDFLSPTGVVKKTAAAVKEWVKAHQTVNGVVTSVTKGRRTVVEWGHDVLDTTGGWLRGLNNPASTMLADMLDNGARIGVDGLLNTPGDVRATLEAINQDIRKRNLARDPGALPEPFVDVNALTGRAAQIFKNRKADGLLGVKVFTSLSRNGRRTTEVVPQLRESFAAAVNREDKGHWGASEGGYYKFWHKGTTEAEYQAIGEELLRNDPKSQRAKEIAAWLKGFFDEYVAPGFTGAYSPTREVHIGFREDWGMARFYSPEKIAANRQAFLDLLMTDDDSVGWVGMQEAQARNLTARIETGVELLPQEQPTTLLSPGAASRKRRNIPLAIDKLLPFLETDISKTLPKYVHSMVRRVEWDRRFSDEKWNGKKWVWHRNVFFDALRGAAEFNNDLPPQRQAQIREQINGIGEAAMGRYGALGADPRVRTGMSFIQTATNFLVLPLAALSQGTDFASPFIRTGGDLKNSLKGMREAFTAMRNTGGDVYKMAEMMGVIFRDTRNAFAASYLDAPYMTEGAQKWNDSLFKWNGMQWLTTFNRIAAWQTSGHWLKDMAVNGHPDATRLLAQLDLTTKDLEEWRDQEFPDYTNGGAKDSVAYKVATARTRFVQESNFAPNATQRPLLANHPYAMLFWSLKSFTYSYFTQMIKPILREVKNNPRWASKAAAALPLLVLLPLAMAGMAFRDELKYGLGRDARSPSDKDDWLETTGKVISRTGIMGPLQLLMDADTASSYGRSFFFALASPTLSKAEEAFRAGSLTPLMPGLSMLPAERQALMRWMAED